MTRKTQRWIAVFMLLLGISSMVHADITLPRILGDNMVLQREQAVPVWGQAEPGEQIAVRFSGQEKKAVADAQGHWRVDLDSMKASAKPQEMVVPGKSSY